MHVGSMRFGKITSGIHVKGPAAQRQNAIEAFLRRQGGETERAAREGVLEIAEFNNPEDKETVVLTCTEPSDISFMDFDDAMLAVSRHSNEPGFDKLEITLH